MTPKPQPQPYPYLILRWFLRGFQIVLSPFVFVIKSIRKTIRYADDKTHKPASLILRARPDLLLEDAVTAMLKERNFFDTDYNIKGGKGGLQHEYERITTRQYKKLIVDHLTGLTWQQSGSEKEIRLEDAKSHIQELNTQNYGGFNDWRLPTLEEAMSLMESKKHDNGLYINPVFDKTQQCIWTSDKGIAGLVWVVEFGRGYCRLSLVCDFLGAMPSNYNYGFSYVRAVR